VAQMISTSGYVSLTTTTSGSILAALNSKVITTNGLTLSAAEDIGQASLYLDANYTVLVARAGTGNIFIKGLTAAPTITSASSAAFVIGNYSSFTVQTSGFPAATLTHTGVLPLGITFTDNHDGTATISGTPTNLARGTYRFTINAQNCAGSAAPQSFTLTVGQPPDFGNDSSDVKFPAGFSSTFTVHNRGYPAPTLTESGTLPPGITFRDNGDGTATIGGTLANNAPCGVYPISVTASNAFGPQTRNFTLEVTPGFVSGSFAAFFAGTSVTLQVRTVGSPPAMLTASGLPADLTFTDNGDGTGTISGTPSRSDVGQHTVTITATSNGVTATQYLTLEIFSPF
jgi:hypothetical protein